MHIRFQFLVAPAVLAMTLVIVAPAVMAAPEPIKAAADNTPGDAAPVRELAPAQLTAIRAIGRNVLAAKKSAVEDPADAAQLTTLRAMVDTLIATDLVLKAPIPITLQGGETPATSPARAAALTLRETTRTEARAFAVQMRQRSAQMASSTQTAPSAQSGGVSGTTSAGMPVANQRAQLFERMAQKLDTALAANNPDRVVQLHALRDQLQAGRGKLVDAPLTHGTPTLQAMPSTSETRIRPVTAAESKFRAAQTPGTPRAANNPRTPRVQAK